MPEKGSGDAKKLVLTFEVNVLDTGDDGWEARCADGDLHLTGIESQQLLVEKVKEHFLGIGDEMGAVGDRVLFNLVLDCRDPDAVPAEAGAAGPERPEPDGQESGDTAAEPRQDQQPGAREPKGAALRTSFAGIEDTVEDLESRVDGLEDRVEDLQSRIDDLEAMLR